MTRRVTDAELDAELDRIRAERNRREGKDNVVGLDQKSPQRWEARATNGKPVASKADHWPAPQALPSGLRPVDEFSVEFLPDSIAPWVDDIANRLQCPPDYVAVSAMTALGAVVGRRIGIKPQSKTEWIEVPNLWGCFIGRPGQLKSPAMGETLKPIHHLEAEAAKENEIAQEAYAAGMSAYALRKQVRASLEKSAMKERKTAKVDVDFDLGDEPQEPVPVRYRTNDCSYEAIGEILIGNPTGVLIERDELVSLLAHLDRDDQAVARGFYLSGWSGTLPYTFDRIVRGHRHVDAVCLSVLGNTQPARIGEYVRRANAGGAGGDGLMQRFGLLVWPDAPAGWRDVDEWPLAGVRDSAWAVFDRLSKIDIAAALEMGAQKGAFDKVPYLRFDDAAHGIFLEWRTDLETRLRSGELSPALEGHLAKYRKLVPALALLNRLAKGGEGQVTRVALLKALAFAKYLESHARRVYGAASEAETAAAKAILGHIHRGELADGFTARDIHQRDWSNLTDRSQVQAGLDLLAELAWILPEYDKPPIGRPTVRYKINPRGCS
jgi:hypothetical protein